MRKYDTMSYTEFAIFCARVPGSQRKGQWAFNVLARVRPALAEEIRTTSLDPFYRDERLPEFYRKVEESWI